MTSDKTIHLISLGCTKNLVDSEIMLGRLADYAITPDATTADLIIINTCGFIEAAKQESLQTILETHANRKPESLLVVSGCLSERYQQELQQELPEVDLFTGVGDYAKIDELIAEKEHRFTPDVFLQSREKRVLTGSPGHAYIKIAEGCNQRCSFCAIPGFKGKLHSRNLDDIIDEVTQLTELGVVDFSFISQDSSSYLRDQGVSEGLIALIESVEKIPGVRSARILYLYPSTTSLALIDKIAESPLFHTYYDMPLQHISDSMLATMKRGLNREKHEVLLQRMREHGGFIRTAFIVGHPGENEADFRELEAFIQEFGFDRISLFAYSDEEGTASTSLPDKLDPTVIDTRIGQLESLVQTQLEATLQAEVNSSPVCYVEGTSEEHEYLLAARRWDWAPDIDGEILINEADFSLSAGQLVHATITERLGTQLVAHATRPFS